MDMILVKLFATALALSEVMTQPQAVKTQFDPAKDQDAVVQILRDGCAHMRQAFDIEFDQCRRPDHHRARRSSGGRRQHQGVPRAEFRGPQYRLQTILQERDRRQSGGRHRPGDHVLQQRRRRSARPGAPQGQAIARHEHGARRQGRSLCRRVPARQPARLGAARRCSRFRAEGVHRRRGPALLSASRHRRARHHPRLHRQSCANPGARRAARPSPSRW